MPQTSPTPRRKAFVETYGCQMNIGDGELMQGVLAASGYDIVGRPEEADVVLVNTCAIREHAEQRVLGRVGELNRLKMDRPDLVIGVTGCMAQRLGETLLERAGYVDLVVGPDGYRRLPEALARLRPDSLGGGVGGVGGAGDPGAVPSHDNGTPPRRALPVLGAVPSAEESAAPRPRVQPAATADAILADGRLALLELTGEENYEGLAIRRGEGVSAWVTVQRGCDHRCTYCIVPYVRGGEKNRSPDRILEEVRGVAARGITEVTLLGQTVNSYRHEAWDFARLLRAVSRVEGIRRVRFMSPHPADVTPELVAVMAEEPAVCRQLHLPVQAGHDRTLKRMLRRYSVAAFLDKVAMVREAMPDIALSTDVIVAFPGETDQEYEATLELMRRVRFDDAFLYRFSPRDGTPATRLPAAESVPDAVAGERLERLIEVHRAIQAERNAAEVGRVVEVLVERAAKSTGDMLGRTEGYKAVAFPGDARLVGRYVDVRLVSTTGATFRGERVERSATAGRVA